MTAQRDLLCYLPRFQVLICKECRYAIQPSALSRHLKDLHHIYRLERRQLLESAERFPLADPTEVISPLPHETSIEFLSSESGLACSPNACTHLCVTTKRMRSHWMTVHRDVMAGGSQWRTVTLQTFFRGNKLRYFIVDSASSPNLGLLSRNENVPDITIFGAPLPDEWTPQDVTLFTHFRTSTYHTLSRRSESRYLWGNTIVLMSFEHQFLKNGILACSALHLAHLQPSSRKYYHLVAALYQGLALPQFRSAVEKITTENCNALLAFSQLLFMHCYASEATDEDLLFVRGIMDSGLPDWLQMLRGSCAMFGAVWAIMENGILANMINEGRTFNFNEEIPITAENSVYLAQLEALLQFPWLGRVSTTKGYSMSSRIEIERMQIYTGALNTLSQAVLVVGAAEKKGSLNLWTAVRVWPAKVSTEYLELLRKRDTGALVILAHYCVLLEPLEEHWFMHKFRKRSLMTIWRQLDVDMRNWIHWPMEEAELPVGVDTA